MAGVSGFRNSLSCEDVNKLKEIKLTARKIEKERVTVVDLGMNARWFEGWYSRECSGYDEGHEWIEKKFRHGFRHG